MQAEHISQAILKIGGAWFALLDGAQLEHTSQRLERSGLSHRCLYIGVEDNQNLKDTAPYLISLNRSVNEKNVDAFLIEKVIVFTGGLTSLVFWQCNDGEEALYKHLRGINKIDIPIQDSDGTLRDEFERVVFRHADANVMAQVMPALNMEELARATGPADYMLFKPEDIWNNKLIHVPRNTDWPQAPNGALRISIPSYQKIIGNREDGIIGKIETYLNKVVPNHELSKPSLNQLAKQSYMEAKEYGIKTEAGHYRWAYFYLITNGEFITQPKIQKYFKKSLDKGHPDAEIKKLMETAIKTIRKKAD